MYFNCLTGKLATVMEGPQYSVPNNGVPSAFDIPLVLRHVALLWQHLTSNCLNAVAAQSNIILVSPTFNTVKSCKKIDRKFEKKQQKSKKKSALQNTIEELLPNNSGVSHCQCDICPKSFNPNTIDEHMVKFHPGCGNPSYGYGYVEGNWKFLPEPEYMEQVC